MNWKESIQNLHISKDGKNNKSKSFRRLVFDEICANFLTLSENRKRIKKIKKIKKFKGLLSNKLIEHLPFTLTKSQKKVIEEIQLDIESEKRMFRIIQGDVGSGKTIVSFLSISNIIESGFQCGLMAPTEILAKQHFELALRIFKPINIKIDFLTGKTDLKKKKRNLRQFNKR